MAKSNKKNLSVITSKPMSAITALWTEPFTTKAGKLYPCTICFTIDGYPTKQFKETVHDCGFYCDCQDWKEFVNAETGQVFKRPTKFVYRRVNYDKGIYDCFAQLALEVAPAPKAVKPVNPLEAKLAKAMAKPEPKAEPKTAKAKAEPKAKTAAPKTAKKRVTVDAAQYEEFLEFQAWKAARAQ